MLDTARSQQTLVYEDDGQAFDLAYLIGLLKRRAFYFAIPFLSIAMAGFAIIKVQQPIYRAEGKVLVESAGISADLLRPTIKEFIDQRFAVLKERILAPDSLIATIDKFKLFPGIRDRMSGFELLELMRSRVTIKPVPLEMQPGAPTTAFSVGFDYEAPELALKVDNAFLNEILAEDTTRRTGNAAATAKLLESQVDKLKSEYDAVLAKIETIKQRPPNQQEAVSEEERARLKSVAELQTELAQKTSVYSDEHPVIKKLKKDISTLKHLIATTPQKTADNDTNDKDVALALQQQEVLLGKSLDEAQNKLAMARLGENLEKNQQAEHMQIIQYPELPGSPIRPKKALWFAIALGLASVIGAATVFVAEMLNRTIRSKKELTRFIDPHLIVSIPYLERPGEQLRRRIKFAVLLLALVAAMGAVTATLVIKQSPVDFAFFGSEQR
jgi:uncharacterized protein involved in exopolysaccharide biosynthesis